MNKFSIASIFILICLCIFPASAKKYKWSYGNHPLLVFTTGQGKNRAQLVNVTAVARNADKAIAQAKMDAVEAALFTGIGYDISTHGMGVSNLAPLVTKAQYDDNKMFFETFFKNGIFMNFVREVNSTYPSGENNISVPQGRQVVINLLLDYQTLRKYLEDSNVIKGLGGRFGN